MIQSIRHPQPERSLGEELILLSKDVQLWISIQYSGGHKLVENTNDNRRENGEDYIVQRQGPGFVRNLSREVVEERELYKKSVIQPKGLVMILRTQNCVIYNTMFL